MSIVLTKLNKRFGLNQVVNNVSLEIRDGEMFVLLGSSGSGKSTILRIIAGLLEPDSGRVEISGRDVTNLTPQARGVGFVFQNYSLFRHMTVTENVEFGLRVRRVLRAERRCRSRELLEAVGLTGLGDRFPDQLSGGQQQRVAVARALAYEPAVLLLDEPFGALDVKIRARMRKRLREIQRNLKVTTILVTHDQEEAFELADRIGVVERGSLLEVGTTTELYHRPRNEFVATFIGGGNVLVGRVREERFWLGQRSFPLGDGASRHDDGAWMRILFRPETVYLSHEQFDPAGAMQTLGQGRISELVFSGPVQRLMVEIEDLKGIRSLAPHSSFGLVGTKIEAVMTTAAAAGTFAVGDRVWVGLREFHVLEPGGLKLLVCGDATASGLSGATWGREILRVADLPATILNGTDGGRSGPLDTILGELQGRPRIRVQNDALTIETLTLEARTGYYDLVVIGIAAGAALGRFNIIELVNGIGLPCLFIPDIPPRIGPMLIATAAGEPGKSDVRFAGRLARRLGVGCTVFHARRPDVDEQEQRRIDRYLDNSRILLDGLGVPAEVLVRSGEVTEAISRELTRGDYGILALGAPFTPAGLIKKSTNFVKHLLKITNLPVLIVPMRE
ncbi:MAG: ATP-binding cassette domain-containing protein [Candidatus Neomarinimicrobiota bacterium]